MRTIILSNDESYLLSSIIDHIIEITEEKDGNYVPNYENLLLMFPKYDWETLKILSKKF